MKMSGTATQCALLVSNGFMKDWSLISVWRIFALVSTLLLPVATRSPACQPPAPQVGTEQGELTAEEEMNSYDIYSILLPTEVRPEWKIAAWAITQQTRTFPNVGRFHNVSECLNLPRDQEPIYLPLIEDYVAKNNRKQTLERKFDLPQYALVDVGRTSGRASLPSAASVIFEVSAVGFNRERTRALVYVGHHCGSLCGGGTYHLLVKKDGKWQVDRDYRGMSCLWAS
jgi:hypothetical protein